MSFYNYFSLFSLSIFLVIFIGRTVMLYLKGIKVFVIGKGKGFLNASMEVFFMFLLVIWLYVSFELSIVRSAMLLPDTIIRLLFNISWIRIIAVILISSGVIIFISALISFRNSWRIGIDTREPDKLITSGIFKYSRNPIFLFLDILFVGMAMIYPSIFMIAFALISVIGLNHQIHHEEQFLLKHYKEEYQEYCKNVRRYF